jgi:hypothetical protein
VEAEEGRTRGKTGYSIKEVSSMMRQTVQEVIDGKK